MYRNIPWKLASRWRDRKGVPMMCKHIASALALMYQLTWIAPKQAAMAEPIKPLLSKENKQRHQKAPSLWLMRKSKYGPANRSKPWRRTVAMHQKKKKRREGS